MHVFNGNMLTCPIIIVRNWYLSASKADNTINKYRLFHRGLAQFQQNHGSPVWININLETEVQ